MRFSLRNPVAIVVFYAIVVGCGMLAYASMGRSLLPRIPLSIQRISAEYPGASARDVDRLLVAPLVQQVQKLPRLDRIEGFAQAGRADVIVRFQYGSDPISDRTNVLQALSAAQSILPADLLPPQVQDDDPAQAPVLQERVSSAVLSAEQLHEALVGVIEPALRSTAGVGSINTVGDVRPQIEVALKSSALAALNLTGADVARALAKADVTLPGGNEVQGDRSASITIRAPARTVAQLRDLPVQTAPAVSVPLRAVADVHEGLAERSVITRVDGEPSLLIALSAAQPQDASVVIARARSAFARLSRAQPLIRFEELGSLQSASDEALHGATQTMAEGLLLTTLVMMLFLHSWRSALIATIAIPTSLAAALLAMWVFGLSLNLLSVMGLSLTIGILVDDSIVIIEAISRRHALGAAAEDAAMLGRHDLGGAAVAITLIDIVTFASLAFMSGLVGAFMREFGLAIIFATAASLLVAYTLTPLLAARWSLRPRTAFWDRPARLLPWTLRGAWLRYGLRAADRALASCASSIEYAAQWYATTLLPFVLERRRAVLAVVAGIVVAGIAPLMLGWIPTEFSPPTQSGVLTADLRLDAATSLQRTDTVTQRLAASLLDNNAIAHVETQAGRANNGSTDVLSSNLAQLRIYLREQSATGDEIMQSLRNSPLLPPDAVISAAGRGMGGAAPITYRLAGEDSHLHTAASRIAALLQAGGAQDVRISDAGLAPETVLDVDPQRTGLLGVTPIDAAQELRIATGGAISARVWSGREFRNVVVRAASAGSQQLAKTSVRNNNNTAIPLSTIVSARRSLQPSVLEEDDGTRTVTVTANPPPGGTIGPIAAAVRSALRSPNFLPAGTRVLIGGDIEQFVQTLSRISLALLIALVAVYAVLATLYASYALPLLVMSTVPLASAGAFGALFVMNALHRAFPSADVFANQSLNLYSMLGVVMLIGLVAKNGILLVDYASRLRREGSDAVRAITSAAQTRFRPILMTTMAMVAGMLPLALGNTAGAMYRKALGTAVIGGLLSSLLLTLIVVPLIYVMTTKSVHVVKQRIARTCASPSFPISTATLLD